MEEQKHSFWRKHSEACDIMSRVVSIPEVDEIHIGLNDLHLAYHRNLCLNCLQMEL